MAGDSYYNAERLNETDVLYRDNRADGATPAAASGLTDHVWTFKELIERAVELSHYEIN